MKGIARHTRRPRVGVAGMIFVEAGAFGIRQARTDVEHGAEIEIFRGVDGAPQVEAMARIVVRPRPFAREIVIVRRKGIDARYCCCACSPFNSPEHPSWFH